MALLSRSKTWSTGETLTASDLNGEFNNIIDNLDPDKVEDASVNAGAMVTTVDPYPASSESLATTLRGELHRLRYVIKQITGETQWYMDPDASLKGAMADDTYCLFYQDAAPTNWTIQNTLDDKLLFVTKGSAAGGETGGGAHSTGTWTQPNHTHTGPSHTHTGPSHNHQWYNIETGSDESYDIDGAEKNIDIALDATGGAGIDAIGPGGGSYANYLGHDCYTGLDSPNHPGTAATGAAGTGATGAGASANTWRPAAYAAIIANRIT